MAGGDATTDRSIAFRIPHPRRPCGGGLASGARQAQVMAQEGRFQLEAGDWIARPRNPDQTCRLLRFRPGARGVVAGFDGGSAGRVRTQLGADPGPRPAVASRALGIRWPVAPAWCVRPRRRTARTPHPQIRRGVRLPRLGAARRDGRGGAVARAFPLRQAPGVHARARMDLRLEPIPTGCCDQDLARGSNFSLWYFTKVFQRGVRHRTAAVRRTGAAGAGRDLLCQPALSINEVAAACGFENAVSSPAPSATTTSLPRPTGSSCRWQPPWLNPHSMHAPRCEATGALQIRCRNQGARGPPGGARRAQRERCRARMRRQRGSLFFWLRRYRQLAANQQRLSSLMRPARTPRSACALRNSNYGCDLHHQRGTVAAWRCRRKRRHAHGRLRISDRLSPATCSRAASAQGFRPNIPCGSEQECANVGQGLQGVPAHYRSDTVNTFLPSENTHAQQFTTGRTTGRGHHAGVVGDDGANLGQPTRIRGQELDKIVVTGSNIPRPTARPHRRCR